MTPEITPKEFLAAAVDPGAVLSELAWGLRRLQHLLAVIDDMDLGDGAGNQAHGLIDGAQAIVGRLGAIADRAGESLKVGRVQDDDDWHGTRVQCALDDEVTA